MQLDLTPEETDALHTLLDSHLSNMYGEISHTDNPAYRTKLRDAREVLRGVAAKLGSSG